ncbi:protein CBFA2T3 [Drosophila eugracilis]|uniref:protein CBFA2T3 n=1 Tax=Drosophila eugracilis TaxID=29029 RepID=UPI001BDAFC05|nr:protein CBFA2T3 [Drosophila eugracilis]
MMALDGKAIIKEEITDKDAYDAAAAAAAAVAAGAALAVATAAAVQVPPASSSAGSASAAAAVATNSTTSAAATAAAISRRLKGDSSGGDKSSSSSSSSKDSSHSSRSERDRERERDRLCRTPPDSPPDSSRSLAPRSPHSPLQLHQRPQRNASVSPVVNGSSGVGSSGTSPTPTPGSQHAASLAAAAAAAAAAHVEQARLVSKMRKFLGALVQFSQELGQPEVSERVRALVLSLCCGNISVEEFRLALQEAINLPLRPYVVPLLKNSIALVQREVLALARATNQSALQYVTNNEQAVMEFAPHGVASTEFGDIFIQLEAPTSNGSSAVFKRRSSDSMMEHGGHNGLQEWSEYMASGGAGYPPPPSKRLNLHPAHSVVAYGDYGVSSAEGLPSAAAFMQRDERDLRMTEAQARHAAPPQRTGNPNPNPNPNPTSAAPGAPGAGGEEEWKNIHTMLNCISAMVDKTKRAITILQQRGIEPQHPNSGQEVTPAAMAELRRQTEEKVAEFKRNAEDAVTQVKRQAVIEIQRAVVAAETRAAEIMTQERLRMEKFFMEMSRHSSGERDLDNKSPSMATAQNGSNLQQQCWNCGRKATETCSGCNMARYCSASCQYRDWDSHHQVCGNSRASELSAKHLHSASSLRSAMATRSPPTPNSAAHLQAAAVAAAAAAGAREAVSAPGPGPGSGVAGGGGAGSGGPSVGGGGGGGGGGGASAAAVAAATPGSLVANGLGSK